MTDESVLVLFQCGFAFEWTGGYGGQVNIYQCEGKETPNWFMEVGRGCQSF